MVKEFDKAGMRKKLLQDLSVSMVVDIKATQKVGALGSPIDFEAKWETLRGPIFENPLLSGAFTFLGVTEEEVKSLLRKAYEECGVGLT